MLWINPNDPQTFIEGNDGGATVTLNGGQAWSSENNQPTGQFYHANLDDQFPFHIYGAQQDRSSVEAPSAVPAGSIPPVWTNVQGGEMSWVVPTPGRPWITYASGYYSKEWRDDRRAGSITNVSPWPSYQFGLAGSKIKYRYGWIHHPVVFAPGNPNELLMGANVLFETLDEGTHWKVISPDLTRDDKSKQARPGGPISADVTGEEMFGTISSIAFSPLTDNVIWTGSDDGLVHVTTDAGGHWSQVRPPTLPTWSTITCIEPSHTDQGTAYVSASRYDWDDFHPYVYKTTDYGKHWTAITAGLPDDQYVESVREDPSQPDLLFAGTSRTAYFSLDGGRQWQPLTLNLPAVRVSDVEIQPDQHAVVLSTFGRGFWVLDDLQFLEQVGAAQVASGSPHLFKPQQAWLVTRRAGGFGRGGAGGGNLAPGVTVFFHLPADYDGSAPVKLSFTSEGGKVIRDFTLHPKRKAEASPSSRDPSAARKQREERGTAVEPGMNRFQWNLRYPDAVDVKGIFNSGFSAAEPVGPEVMPGTYYVTLSYDGATQKQPFVVKLDPRLQTTQAELQQRFDLLMQLHDAVNQLDTNLNQAIAARDALRKAVANGGAQDHAQEALDDLNRDIDGLVDLKIQSGEGALVYPGLAALLADLHREPGGSGIRAAHAGDGAGRGWVHPRCGSGCRSTEGRHRRGSRGPVRRVGIGPARGHGLGRGSRWHRVARIAPSFLEAPSDALEQDGGGGASTQWGDAGLGHTVSSGGCSATHSLPQAALCTGRADVPISAGEGNRESPNGRALFSGAQRPDPTVRDAVLTPRVRRGEVLPATATAADSGDSRPGGSHHERKGRAPSPFGRHPRPRPCDARGDGAVRMRRGACGRHEQCGPGEGGDRPPRAYPRRRSAQRPDPPFEQRARLGEGCRERTAASSFDHV